MALECARLLRIAISQNYYKGLDVRIYFRSFQFRTMENLGWD